MSPLLKIKFDSLLLWSMAKYDNDLRPRTGICGTSCSLRSGADVDILHIKYPQILPLSQTS